MKTHFTEKFTALLYREYLAGASIPDLATTHSLCASSIQRAFKRLGFSKKSKKVINQEKALKTKKTVKERYGVENVMQAEQVKETLATSFGIKYGGHPAKTLKVKQAKVQKSLELVGTDFFFQSDDFKTKTKKTLNERYGVDHPLRDESIADKAAASKKRNRLQTLLPRLSSLGYSLLEDYIGQRVLEGGKHSHYIQYLIEHHCGEVFHDDLYMEPRCPKCFPFNSSLLENRYFNFIKELGHVVLRNDRKTIVNPISGRHYELDIFLPDLKIAFEVNGVFFHAGRRDHHIKTELCLNKGIQLFHIWEWQKEETVKVAVEKIVHKKDLTMEDYEQLSAISYGENTSLIYCDRDWCPSWQLSSFVKNGFKFERDEGFVLRFFDPKTRNLVETPSKRTWKLWSSGKLVFSR